LTVDTSAKSKFKCRFTLTYNKLVSQNSYWHYAYLQLVLHLSIAFDRYASVGDVMHYILVISVLYPYCIYCSSEWLLSW